MGEIPWFIFNNKLLLACKNLRRKERKPGKDIHMKLGRKKTQEIGRLTSIIAKKRDCFKENKN